MNEIPREVKEAARRLSGPMLNKGFKPVALHAYTDAEGKPLYWRIRAKHPDTGEKWIRPLRLNNDTYKIGEPKFDHGKLIYGLHLIVSNPDAVVWIVEGEQKADVLNKLGMVATTSGSATSAAAADWGPLRGRTVIIWPDNDEPGRAYAGEVANILVPMGCAVSCVDVAKLGLGESEDVIDWLAAHPGAPRADIEAMPRLTARSRQEAAREGDIAGCVSLLHGANVKLEPISWVWNGYLARGKLHILAGAPGTGKTTLAIALAATLTVGGRWPDGTIAKPGNVLIWSGEDDPGDTLAPRLIACGADMARVTFVGSVTGAQGEQLPFDPARDLPGLRLALAGHEIALMIVDPVVSAVLGDSHKNAEVRRGLQPIHDLARELNCAALGISHFSKGTAGRDPVERVTGSVAFGALPRIVLAAAKLPDDAEGGGGRLLVRAKSNIGPDTGGFKFDLGQTEFPNHPGVFASRVLWGEAVEGTARELLATAETSEDDERAASTEAGDVLRELLSTGPMEAKEATRTLRGLGFSDKQIRIAREKSGVKPYRDGFGKDGKWFWSLPHRRPDSPLMPIDAPLKKGASKAPLVSRGRPDHPNADADAEVF